jgi:protein gp37
MANSSSIEWTEATWNPLTGCTKVSPGCKHCYAERMARRLQAMRHPSYANGFRLTLHEHLLELPLRWKRPRTIFVNSMSDLFHRDVPAEFIQRVFRTMCDASQHRFQVLTKRPERALELSPLLPWPDNVWLGTSVETDKYAFRIDLLRRTGARTKFLSLEPLLGPLSRLDLEGIDWVIVGGESGPGARPMDPAWAVEIRDQCVARGVPFFFKQWGGVNKKRTGRLLEGRTWDAMPAAPGCQQTPGEASPRSATRQLALI